MVRRAQKRFALFEIGSGAAHIVIVYLNLLVDTNGSGAQSAMHISQRSAHIVGNSGASRRSQTERYNILGGVATAICFTHFYAAAC